jgi:hypothetical protein
VLSRVSKVIINSIVGRSIQLKRGVRQGDPISPYPFNLAMDFLAAWMTKLQGLNLIHKPFLGCKPYLQYANNTLLLLQPTLNQLLTIKLIFSIFAQLSSLTLNMLKSEITITHSSQTEIAHLELIIECKAATLPMSYLRLSLSDKPLKMKHYQQLIQAYKDQLSGWKAHLLYIGGRLILLNAVMAAKSIYFMSVFMVPKGVIAEMDRIKNQFLWHGHKESQMNSKPRHLINWRTILMPREAGELGIRDPRLTNKALMMKWMWTWHKSADVWWKEISGIESIP